MCHFGIIWLYYTLWRCWLTRLMVYYHRLYIQLYIHISQFSTSRIYFWMVKTSAANDCSWRASNKKKIEEKQERKTEHQISIATIKHFRSTSKATHTSAKCKAYIKSTRMECYICSCNHEYYHSQSGYLMVWHTGAQEIKLIEHPYFRFQHLNLEVCTS